jgi:hypothetical protein
MRTNRAYSLSGEARRALELLAQSARDANEELFAISRPLRLPDRFDLQHGGC